MKHQVVNPFLPSYEYIPDGEPRVFGNRLYIFGSHDCFAGSKYCQNDYVTWSAPTDDLGNWRYEGVIYRKEQDTFNLDGNLATFAPDVVQGPDGRYYLYYCLAEFHAMGVAVSDCPAGPYQFADHIKDSQGGIVGQRPQDSKPFDPAVLVDDDGRIWLYTGNGPIGKPSKKFRQASVVMELMPDMVTIKSEPKPLIPLNNNSQGTGFEGHEFFEASSIRKFEGKYYFVYSSILSHELCWAVSNRPDEGFRFGGTLVSNGDIGLEGPSHTRFSGRASKELKNYIGNNHGGMVKLGDDYYIFYHRQTNRHGFSRQACAERLQRKPDGSFCQSEMTSCGLNGSPLEGTGKYEARIACQLYSKQGAIVSAHPMIQNKKHPAFTQDGVDREDTPNQHIQNMRDGAVAVFKFFNFKGAKKVFVTVRGKGKGVLYVRSAEHGAPVAMINVTPGKEWASFSSSLTILDGVHPLYFTYKGRGAIDFLDFTLA